MINTYSLGDHTVTISGINLGGLNIAAISLGGYGENNRGSFTDSISLIRNEALWSTEGDYTGSWVHNKNMNGTGAVVVRLRQVSDNIPKLQQLAEVDRATVNTGSANQAGVTITVQNGAGATIGEAIDCHIEKIPDQVFGNTAEVQEWRFTAGLVEFKYPDLTAPENSDNIATSESAGESTGE